jgi:hypothetical protein
MNSEDYKTKMIEHLTLSGSYRKLASNPIARITKEVKKVIKDSNLDELTKKHLLPSCEITPRIYGLPKIHKEGIPLRPIVNTIGSPTYQLEKYVAKILGPLVGNTDSFIKDSSDFIRIIKNERVEPMVISSSTLMWFLSSQKYPLMKLSKLSRRAQTLKPPN